MQCLLVENIKISYKVIILLSQKRKEQEETWRGNVCVNSNFIWREEAACSPPGYKSFVPGHHIALFSKIVGNLRYTILQITSLNQLKQAALRTKLHTNVPDLGTLFCAFSWVNFYAHSKHNLKLRSLPPHRRMQDCCYSYFPQRIMYPFLPVFFLI